MDDPTDLPRVAEETGRSLKGLDGAAERFGASLLRAFSRSVAEGRRFDEVLKSMRRSLDEVGTRSSGSGMRSVAGAIGGLLGGLLKQALSGALGSGGVTPFAKGGVIAGGLPLPMAGGGVIAAPTGFPLRRGAGLMGEAGAEAVLPLARGPDGRLGVRAGGGRAPVSVAVTIVTPDPEAFRRSEAQVAAGLARAVARGQRGL